VNKAIVILVPGSVSSILCFVKFSPKKMSNFDPFEGKKVAFYYFEKIRCFLVAVACVSPKIYQIKKMFANR
jgi:hypothetical protein